jgi:hypothetical protein
MASSSIFEGEVLSRGGSESGYDSGSSSETCYHDVLFTKAHLKFLNQQLQRLEPEGSMLVTPMLLMLIANKHWQRFSAGAS